MTKRFFATPDTRWEKGGVTEGDRVVNVIHHQNNATANTIEESHFVNTDSYHSQLGISNESDKQVVNIISKCTNHTHAKP